MPSLVLVVEDETILGDSISLYLERHGLATALARSGEEAIKLAEESSPDVAVMDVRLPGINGLEVLRRMRELSPGTEVVMMTAHASVASAVEAMKLGAFDYLTKPLDLDELRVVVEKALSHQRMRRELSYLKAREETGGHLAEIVGESPPIRTLKQRVERIASLESSDGSSAPTVLILGETGAGKEMVARAIHYGSARAKGPFVEINCAAIPASLLEAELFGYEKGAYTDARTAKPGLFEAADGGTLFLDEIGHMDVAIQVKLLKAIEEKAVRRVGGLRMKSFNARIIAATNRDMDAAIAEGAFRSDLYYRIKALTLEVPPLRERGTDIILLARHFLERFTRQYGLPPRTLSPEAEALLQAYAWPGNVRELAHVMERAVLLHASPTVQPDHLGLSGSREKASVAVGAGGGVHVDFAVGGIVLDEVERQLITGALQAVGWNRTKAAQLLGISKETLRYRMEKYQLQGPTAG
jgi:two-component system, NtrC family, response regulator AtoC